MAEISLKKPIPITEEKIVKPVIRETPKIEVKEEVGKEVVAPQPVKEQVKQKEGPVTSPEDYYITSPLFHKVADYFGLERTQWELAKNQLSIIVDWAILESESNRPEDILSVVSQLEKSLRSPGYGERRYANVYRFVRLLGHKRSIEKEMEVYKNLAKEKAEHGETHSPSTS